MRGGGGGANFLTSEDFQIFFGALYHEIVLSSPEHKGSDNVEFLSSELFDNPTIIMYLISF